jgi:hypothetical protein
VWPGEAALDDRAVAAEPGAVLDLAAGELRFNPALPDKSATKASGSKYEPGCGGFRDRFESADLQGV